MASLPHNHVEHHRRTHVVDHVWCQAYVETSRAVHPTHHVIFRQQAGQCLEPAELVEDPDGDPNPFTNLMHFHLVSSDEDGERKIFPYRNWTVWSQPILVTLARLLDLNVLYYHSEMHEFVSVDEEWDDCDVDENVTFMIFTRRDLETGEEQS